MANTLYPTYVNALLTGTAGPDLSADDIRVILVDGADYTFSSAHDFLDDVPAGARVATVALTGESVTSRTFDAADATFSSVTGDQSEILIIYDHTGVEGTSRLIAYIDSATNLPITPNGGDITVSWDDGADKIFTL